MVLVATKVHVPDVRPGLVSRDALVARLAGGADRRLSVICAPAGWGKTVLLAQWHASERRPFAWVSLDPSDDDPVRFWSYVIAALRTVVPGFGGAVLAALPNAGPGLVDVVLPRLINELAELPEPVVLVLDDLHVLGDELVHASLAFVIRHLPRTLHVALATRAEPPLPLARLRAAGELVELRADELAFGAGEAEALLGGLDLERADVELLWERTEGWAAGLQLAALSLRERADRPTFIRSLAGDDRQIGDYLHEVIESAERPLREFLLRTAILERMCGPLCEAVTGDPGAAALLAEAYRSNLFVVMLDERGHWYRYHHLLRDLLLSELDRGEPELVAELHSRAALWFQANGDVDAAIEHAIAAGGIDDAKELILANWHSAWHANPRTVERWLDALGAGAVQADPRLCLARGWTSMFMGRLELVEPMIRAAERNPLREAPRDELGSIATKASLLRSCLAHVRGDVGRTYVMAGYAQGDAAPAAKALANMLLGLALYFRGDGPGAIEALERAQRKLPAADWLQMRVTTFGVLAAAKAEAGDTAAAEVLAGQAERLIADYGFGASPTASLAVAAGGMVLEARGEHEAADAAYTRAALLARRAGWVLDEAHALLLHVALKRRRRDLPGARALILEARRAVGACADAGVLEERLEDAERALQIVSQRESAGGDSDLSEREIAVLRLLATDLSQREIGSQLFVSFNTVKSHTRTLFRKLGVTSRADAVARGRELGLV
jgi:LuxR family maltose regulon positive regulatory protein